MTERRARTAAQNREFERARALLSELNGYWAEDERVLALEQSLEVLEQDHAASQALVERQTRVTELLQQAQRAFRQGQLVQPADPNAADLYQQALSLDPENLLAETGLATIVERLVNSVVADARGGRFDAAARSLADAERLAPEDARLSEAAEELRTARVAVQKAEEARQARDALDQEVAAFGVQVAAWTDDAGASLDALPALEASLSALRNRAPNHPQLRTLGAALAEQAERLTAAAESAAAEAAEKEKKERFRISTF